MIHQSQLKVFQHFTFFPSNNKDKPLQYDGGRTVSAFVKYLQEHTVASKEELAKVHVPEEKETPQKHGEESEVSEENEVEDEKVKHDEL